MIRRAFGHGPVLGVLLAIAGFVALGSWAVASPVGASPDEAFHLASIWCAGVSPAHRHDVVCAAGPGERTAGVTRRWVPTQLDAGACFAFRPAITAVCVKEPARPLTSLAANAGLYPPGFHRAMHLAVGTNITASVLTMRLANALLAVLVFAWAHAVSGRHGRFALAALASLAAAPMAFFFIPSVNPTSWSVIGIGTLWAFVLAFLEAPTRPRAALALVGGAVAFALAVSARSDAPVYAAATIVAAATCSTARRSARLLVLLGGVAIAVALFVMGSATNVTTHGMGAPPGVTGPASASGDTPPGQLLIHNIEGFWHFAIAIFAAGSHGYGLGALDTHMPLVSLCVTVLVSGVVALGLAWGRWRERAVLLGLVLASVAIPLDVLQQSRMRIESMQVQPRYVYPLMLAAVGIAAFVLARRPEVRRLRRAAWLAVWVIVAVAASWELHAVLHRYVSGEGSHGFRLDASAGWWWSFPSAPSPFAVWAVGSASAAVTFGLLLRQARANAGDEPGHDVVVAAGQTAADSST